MKSSKFTIYEHEALIEGEYYNDNKFTAIHHALLENYYKEKNFPYYKLIRKGVRFCEYVGVLQVGHLVIEVLPKADNKKSSEQQWRSMLIDMLRAVGVFNVKAPSSSSLSIKPNSILDLYFKLFVEETEQLLHKGLIKHYHKTEGNRMALKGSIVFGKHIQQNLVHQERFYVRYTTYDQQHPLNAVLYKTLQLIKQINTNQSINSRIGNLLLNFPEMPAIKTDDAFFERINYNRKSEAYHNAINIARMLLLNYHPDVSTGKNDVLALMFDMNKLWEQFVAVSLRKYISNTTHLTGTTLTTQSRFDFWKPENGYKMRLRPDIVITLNDGKYYVLDTKWKNRNGYKPSPDDLRQMYTYSKFHNDAITALVYPGDNEIQNSYFINETDSNKINASCKLIEIPISDTINAWQTNIGKIIFVDDN